MHAFVLAVVSPVPYLVACVLVLAALVWALVALRRGAVLANRLIPCALALLLGADVVAYLIGEVVAQTFSLRASLPLALCNAAVLVAVVALVTRVALLVELTWYVGLAGTLQAILTPDLSSPFPHLVFFEYLVGHLGIVSAALVLVVGMRRVPRPGSWWRCYLVVAAYTAFVGAIDWASGADYMFLRRPPANATLLSVLGPFPWYIASACGVALVLFVVLGAPFSPVARARAYGAWAWTVMVAVALFAWPAVVLAPPRWRWKIYLGAGRALVAATRISVRVVGDAPFGGPYVYVANHDSYVDGLVLSLVVPRAATLVVTGAIARQRIAGPFLRALGVVFVGPATGSGAKTQLEVLASVLRSGGDLAGFPEGGLARRPGPRRLRSGLFLAAAEARCPVVPVAISGTGDLVAPGTKRVHRAPVEVRIGAPIVPVGTGLEAARALAARVAAVLGPHREDGEVLVGAVSNPERAGGVDGV